MSSKTRLVVHAGQHRTGSTSLQRSLSQGKAILKDHGVAYPTDFAPESGEYITTSINHGEIFCAIRDKKITATQLRDWLRSESARCPTIIISFEEFYTLTDLSLFAELRNYYEIEVIIYLRRQDDWLNSWYNVNISWPFDGSLRNISPRAFLDRNINSDWLKYFDVLERWSSALGEDRVHVRVHEKSQVTDVVSDFLYVCGLSDVPVPRRIRVNESFPVDQLMLLRSLQMMRFSEAERLRIHVALLEQMPSRHTTNVYPAKVREMILARFTDQNAAVARKYLNRPDGVLFRDLSFPDDDGDMDGRRSVDENRLPSFIRRLLWRSRLAQLDPRRWWTGT